MRNMSGSDFTKVVLDRYETTPDPRLRQILQSLISRLHAFVRDVRLTEQEWMEGIGFLTRTGQVSDLKRQEMILLSDNLGISALVNLVSADVPEGATETTVIGPFYVSSSPDRQWAESVLLRESSEPPLLVHGRVRDMDGAPIPARRSRSGRPTRTACTTSRTRASRRTTSAGATSPTPTASS